MMFTLRIKNAALFVAFCLSLAFATLNAQVSVPFTVRYQVNQKGSIYQIGNTITTCNGSGNCATATSTAPPSGSFQNNNYTMAYVDFDGDPSTFSSSSDSMALPNCSQITFAGLYWGATIANNVAGYNTRNQVKIKINNNSYQTLTADTMINNTIGFTTYHCYKNVTGIMQTAGRNARVSVADIVAQVGSNNKFGGWTLVVVYKNDLEDMRNLTIFNGLANITGAIGSLDVPVSGFLTPPSGPVNLDIGIMAFDGDRGFNGDSLLFRGGTNPSFVSLANAVNPAGDMFNSTSSRNGVQTPWRLPSFNNNLGVDIDVYKPNNSSFQFIGNSQTSATFRMKTGGETYLPQVITTAIDVYEPDVRVGNTVTDINGGLLLPNDIVEYTITVKNIGSDIATLTTLIDTMYFNIDYIPGSMQIVSGPNAGAKTDAAGDDQADYFAASNRVVFRIGTGANGILGGNVANSPLGNDSTVIKFRGRATTDCLKILCDNDVPNRAYITYRGQISGNNLAAASNPGIFDGNGCPVEGSTATVISAPLCTPPADTTVYSLCPPASATLLYTRPGYSFFNSSFQSVTTFASSGTYYAIRTIVGSYSGPCIDTVMITAVITPCVDTDGDGILNPNDLDDDNDGIPDFVEACGVAAVNFSCIGGDPDADADQDGIPNYMDANFCTLNSAGVCANLDADGDGIINGQDVDSDNDGITDVREAGGTDANGDGRIDGFADSDGDGLANSVDPSTGGTPLTVPNSDGNGNPNYLDVDSDNDGIPDVVEAGGTDANGDGRIDGFVDSDDDGLADSVDPSTSGTPLPVGDKDGDGRANYVDLDSDNDGIQDAIEAGGTDPDNDGQIGSGPIADTDGDGLSNIVDTNNGGTALAIPNMDGDVVPNYLDKDSDNDGITDASEASGPTNPGDPDNNGVIGNAPLVDVDGDGWSDNVDPNAGGIALTIPNRDGSGGPNYLDLDSDADGIPDVLETRSPDADNDGFYGTGMAADLDQDGLPDGNDPDFGGPNFAVFNQDREGDGHLNYLDIDSDNDGIVDLIEGQPTATFVLPSGTDTDGDGIDNSYDVNQGGVVCGYVNTDGGSAPDWVDVDSDNDGIYDVVEAGLPDPDNNGWVGTGGNAFNTTSGPLPDADNDGLTDLADLVNGFDSDNNQTVGSMPDVQQPGGDRDWRDAPDNDGDGVNDNLDPDDDNDGILDVVEGTGDTDGDNIPNNEDLDSDNDGIPDVVEAGGTDPDGNGLPGTGAVLADADADGIPNLFDVNSGNGPLTPTDFDGDGNPNYLDLDSDDDGIADVVEAGGSDPDNNGQIGTGVVIDTDADGLSDIADTNNGGTPLTIPNTDGTGGPNYLDRDSDNDGIADVIEAGGIDPDGDGVYGTGVPADTDNDGLNDLLDTDFNGNTLPNIDTDSDGRPNTMDLDADNDGIVDIIEAGGVDTDSNGLLDAFADSDNDGLGNTVDSSTGGTALPTPNSDNNGRPNFLDIDSDNDGIVDVIEAQTTTGYIAPANADGDGDGIDNAYDNFVGYGGNGLSPVNTDNATDGADYIDTDADNDLVSDAIEGWDTDNDGVANTLPSGNDADGDGLDNAYDSDGTSTTNGGLSDNNNQVPTGFPDLDNAGGDRDWREQLDSDGDGIANVDDLDD
ncbi:MAG: hypothetical protein ACRCYO_14035, partial [Bacteroidia bacterium]